MKNKEKQSRLLLPIFVLLIVFGAFAFVFVSRTKLIKVSGKAGLTPTPVNFASQRAIATPASKPTLDPKQFKVTPLPSTAYKPKLIPSKWKSYYSTDSKFSMKYPDYWTYKESESQAYDNMRFHTSGVNPTSPMEKIVINKRIAFGSANQNIPNTDVLSGAVIISTDTESNFKALSIDDVVNLYYKVAGYSSMKKYKIANLEVVEVHHSSCPSSTNCITVFFKNKDTLFEVFSNSDKERYENLPIIYQMISSIEFEK